MPPPRGRLPVWDKEQAPPRYVLAAWERKRRRALRVAAKLDHDDCAFEAWHKKKRRRQSASMPGLMSDSDSDDSDGGEEGARNQAAEEPCNCACSDDSDGGEEGARRQAAAEPCDCSDDSDGSDSDSACVPPPLVCCKALRCSSGGQRGRVGVFPKALVSDLRRYYNALPPEDQEEFVLHRMHLPVGRVARHVYPIEAPEVLAEALDSLRTTDGGFEGRLKHPKITGRSVVIVCRNFLCFLIGLTKNAKFLSRSGRVIKGTHFKPRDDRKRRSAVEWVRGTRKQHCVLPTSDLTVLPFRDVRETHAAYVEETEELLGVAWAAEARRGHGPSAYDESDDVEDGEFLPSVAPQLGAADGEAPAGTGRKNPFRYGNPSCGRRDAPGSFPEAPSIANISWFRDVWLQDPVAKKSVCRKHIPFAKCDHCVVLRQALRDTRDFKTRNELQQRHRDHIREVNLERGRYWAHRDWARQHPGKHLSLCIDGADQSDHAIPHCAEKTHTSGEAYKAKVHVTGVIAHGRDTYVYTCPSHVKFGHNMTIQAVWDTICDIQKRDEGRLPSVMYIQLDNTTRQNKGRGLSAFCELLVGAGLFERIYVCFLPVGHTHEDIDQFFSRIAIRLRKFDAWSRQHLAYQIRESYTTPEGRQPIVRHWDSVANITGWLRGENADGSVSSPRMDVDANGWMAYRHLRFVRGSSGRPETQFRVNVRRDVPNDPWTGLERSQRKYHGLKENAVSEFLMALKSRTIPKAQRTEPNKDYLKKRLTSIKAMQLLYKDYFTEAAVADCNAMIEMELCEDDIPFHWEGDDIDAMLSLAKPTVGVLEDEIQQPPVQLQLHGAVVDAGDCGEDAWEQNQVAAVAGPSEDVAPAVLDPWWEDLHGGRVLMTVNSFWILKPCAGSQWHFWLGKVKQVGDKDGVAGARVQWWIPNRQPADSDFATEESRMKFYKEAKYGLEKGQATRSRDLGFVPFGTRDDTPYQCFTKTKKGGSNTLMLRQAGNRHAIGWVEASCREPDSSEEDDD